MITVYTTNSCSSCKKAIKWLNDHLIKFTEKNLFTEPITRQDIKIMLENTENGFEDIISTRSKAFQNLNVSIDDMTYNELVDFIINNPSVLRRPIIVDDRKMQIGYNDDEIRAFIPAELRKILPCECGDCDYKRLVQEYLQKNAIKGD